MSEDKVIGADAFTMKDVTPHSVIYRYKNRTATMVYDDGNSEGTKIVSRPFEQYFSNLNTKVLDLQNDIILPNGCIYRAALDNGEEAFLIQDVPGIRTFRLTNSERVKDLVGKMYNKFMAQTRVLELNEPEPGTEEDIKRQIALRNQYISKQKLKTGKKEDFYKLHFRVYFPYTYLGIVIKRKTNNSNSLSFSRMSAMISLTAVNTMNDYLYQFPLSNVSRGGNVCTGKLPLGEFGYINVKSYVEKMAGYFWNNRFNSDITAGPELYGNKNFLGNWFEWEYKSFIDPAAVLSLDFEVEEIKEDRISVGDFIYSRGRGSGTYEKSFMALDEWSILDCFETNQAVGDSYVDLEHGTAKKNIASIAESIEAEGYVIPVGTILKNEKDKKFKIISYDGFKTYDVSDSTLQENEVVVTHVNLRDENRKTYRLNLDKGLKFILRAYRKAKNFVEDAVCGSKTFNIGQLVCVVTDGRFTDPYHELDMIKSIREKDGTYIFEFHKRVYAIANASDEEPNKMRQVGVNFGSKDDPIENGVDFTFRTKKLLDGSHKPSPFTIRDHLSEIQTGKASILRYAYETKRRSSYHYGSSANRQVFTVYSQFQKEGFDHENASNKFEDCDFSIDGDMVMFYIPLPKYIYLAKEEFEEITPTINGSESVVIGERVYQAISGSDEPEEVTFKIMRDSDGNASISTVGETREAVQNMFFHMSIDHIKQTLIEVDGVKTFRIRDLFEAGTEREYIEFKVGDEIMMTADWNPTSEQKPSIKKILDFFTVEDRMPNELETSHQAVDDHVLSGMVDAHAGVITNRYKRYAEALGREDIANGIKANRGVLYVVVDDGTEKLKIHPMIDSMGQHFLNGITHVKKQVGDLKIGDFIKANVARIPYFAKKDVDQIAAFIEINGRDIAILNNGLTMWCDIIESHFKVFHRDKLTESKIEFYEGKIREPNMGEFMLMYGDMYVGKLGLAVLTPDECDAVESDFREEKMKYLYQDSIKDLPTTINMTRDDYDEGIEQNGGSCHFHTLGGFNSNNLLNLRYDISRSTFRCLYGKILGGSVSTGHIAQIGIDKKQYDLCYALYNRSLSNGAAYLPMRECFYDPMVGYRYYSSPFRTDQIWSKLNNFEATLATFPTPRVLKNMTRKKDTYTVFKFMGPQNRFYNRVDRNDLSAVRSGHRLSIKNDEPIYNITSDDIFPEVEIEADIDVTDLVTD